MTEDTIDNELMFKKAELFETYFKDWRQKTLNFYDRDQNDNVFVNSITGMCKIIETHMDGNYGLGNKYIIVEENGTIKTVQYHGDSSATIKILNK